MSKNYYQILQVKKGWRKIPHSIFYDENLTSDAKVVISELLSVSGEFHISESGIASSLHLSLERVKKAIKLLKSAGYLQIVKVKDGSRYGGYEWRISDMSGIFRKTENQTLGNQTHENPDNLGANSERRKTERSETERMETTLIYQRPKDQTRIIKDEDDQDRMYQRRKSVVSPTPFSTPNQVEGNIFSSGEVNITQAFNRFCEVYPKLGDRESAREAFFAIPDISNICHQIANSVEWFEKNKKWDDWKTGQKNIYCPQAVKFLERGDWQEYLKSGATMSTRDRILAVLAKERSNDTNG